MSTSMPKAVWLLALIQALAMSAGAMMVLIGGVLGSEIAPDPSLSTLPIAVMIVGTALSVLPVTRAMQRYQRKPVFIVMSIGAMSAALIASAAAFLSNFTLFLGAAFVLGISIAGFQQIRFAAMESVSPDRGAQAASRVLLGGLFAALLGPELATFGRDLFPTPFVGSFVMMACLAGTIAILFSLVPFKTQQEVEEHSQPSATSQIVTKPGFVIAVSAAVVGYALMAFIMTATPVHMHVISDFSLESTKWVIQSHIIAMYLPSFFSGTLIRRLGPKKVMSMGLFAYLLTIVMGLSGTELLNYWVALILLGIGWNFLFLAGTVMLPSTYHAQDKFKAQGINEFCVFGAQSIASLGAGAMLFAMGWQGLMFTSLAIVGAHIMLLLWQTQRSKRAEYATIS